jgi:hypothetical protein
MAVLSIQDPTAIRAESTNDTLPRDRQREPIAQGLIANSTNGITKDMATHEIVYWSMADHPGAAYGRRGDGRSGTEPVAAGSLTDGCYPGGPDPNRNAGGNQ